MSRFNLTSSSLCSETPPQRNARPRPERRRGGQSNNTSPQYKDGDRHMAGFLDKERIIAGPGFNRWLVPPAALAIHLCIGMAYGFSVFWLPLSKALGIKESVKCGPEVGFFAEMFTTSCDWKISTLGWMYTLFFVFLGCSAALWGGWLERAGPRKAGVVKVFASPESVGVMPTFIVMALIYFVFMMAGALGYRVPATGWQPEGWTPPAIHASNTMITQRHVHVKNAFKIPQFWLVWMVLCMNVSAGIGVIGMASPMLQEVFGGSLIGVAAKYGELDKAQLAAIAGVAADFTALLSLFNIGGRFFWASLSDKLGRKMTYVVFFVLGGVLYFGVPGSAAAGSTVLFVGAFCIILSMYGGGFATVPAYLADLFGTQFVGAIHGRLLTAWATAGILGPVVVNYMREYQLSLGIAREQVYNQTMYILVGMLVIGLICNLLVRPVVD